MLLEGLSAASEVFFSFHNLLFLVIGVLTGLFFGFFPGLSGITVLVVLMPFTIQMETIHAITLVLSAHAVIVTGDALTAVLFNIPGTSQSIATCFDGYPLALKGRAAEAIAASLTASMMGGIFGALFLLAAIPVFRPLTLLLGSAEYTMLILFGIFMIALLGEGAFMKGLISGGIGLLCSFIGFDLVTGSFRFAFGSNYLYRGLHIVPVATGIFAIAQMINLIIEGGTIANKSTKLEGYRGVGKGIVSAFRHFSVVLRSSVLGALVGFVPGIGGTVANIMAYGLQVSVSPDKSMYGKGDIKGVLAPESANNAKEGGALVTTLAFGIPGSSSMAVMLSILMLKGIVPGPNMVMENLHITMALVLILITANVLAATLTGVVTPFIEKVTTLSVDRLVPIILVVCVFGVYSVNGSLLDVLAAVLFGLIGYMMNKHAYSPAAFIIGLVLGVRFERSLHVSLRAWGPAFIFQRPIALGLLLFMIFLILWSYKHTLGRKEG